MINYNDIEERILHLMWNYKHGEAIFMVELMSKFYSILEKGFLLEQKRIFDLLMKKHAGDTGVIQSDIYARITQNHDEMIEQNGSNSILVFYTKFLYSIYELIFEYSVKEADYLEKQDDIIENFTIAYENIEIDADVISTILDEIAAKV